MIMFLIFLKVHSLYLVVNILFTDLHVESSGQNCILSRQPRVIPASLGAVRGQKVSLLHQLVHGVLGDEPEGGNEGAQGRRQVEVATLPPVEGGQGRVPTARGAEDDLGAGGAAQARHHRPETRGAVGGQVGDGEDGGQGLLLHQDLAHSDVLGGQDVSPHLLTELHSQLAAYKPVPKAGKQKRGRGNFFTKRLF